MFSKTFDKSYDSEAFTLSPDDIGTKGMWTLRGEVHNDYYAWVNEFEAEHLVLGKVWGDFDNTVYADDEETFNDFMKHFTPYRWDYHDI